MSTPLSCPICQTPVVASGPGRPELFPFCSSRCKLIDLGAWLGERYRVAGAPAPDESEQIPPSVDREDEQ